MPAMKAEIKVRNDSDSTAASPNHETTRPGKSPGSTSSTPLRVEKISKSFGDLRAVSGFTNGFHAGELMALLGPNGAGKTTLIRMLTGILKPDTGAVYLNDQIHPGRDVISRYIGYCPQRIIVWRDLTCFEQLVLMGNMYDLSGQGARARADELLKMFNLSAKKNALARTLSGGMQRRLSVALAMVHRPAVLVLDEPEAGLDPQSRVLIRNILHELSKAEGTAVVLSTHDMAEAELLSSRVAIMNRGQLLGDGTPAELIESAGSAWLLELRMETVSDTERHRLVAALGRLGARIDSKDKTILLDSDAQGALVRPVRRVAAEEKVGITELRHRRRTLEDVFLSLTANTPVEPSVGGSK